MGGAGKTLFYMRYFLHTMAPMTLIINVSTHLPSFWDGASFQPKPPPLVSSPASTRAPPFLSADVLGGGEKGWEPHQSIDPELLLLFHLVFSSCCLFVYVLLW
jgi:hypothetical protein